MSRRSVTRSAISPPSWVNIVTNWSTAPDDGAYAAGLPALIRFSAAPIQARSCASVAVVASTSDAAPEVARGALAQSFGHRGRGGGEARHLGGPSRFVQVGRLGLGVDARPDTGPDHRCVLHAPYSGYAVQDGARWQRWPSGSQGVTWSKVTYSCEPDY